MATTSRQIVSCGIAWPPPRDGWCSSRIIAGRPGYGDKFALQIVPEIVSRPGKRYIDAAVDALVKDELPTRTN